MIEISHKQAQFLIRETEDRRLPEEQWTALQIHLERCEACRAYRDRLALLEKHFHHLMEVRWRRMEGPSPAVVSAVRAARKRRKPHSLRPGYLILAAVVIVALVALARMNRLPTPASLRPVTSPTAPPKPTPTPSEPFRGVVLFAADQGGTNDIFLLSATGSTSPELTNLTQNPADDTAPIWSPDGEWIAFLSNRPNSPGADARYELYVMTIAGTRLTRLTGDPDIEWQGPLSWSADGRWIALTGKRKSQNGDAWMYLVPVGADAQESGRLVSLPETRGTTGWARFSPVQPLLAVQLADGGIVVYDLTDGWSGHPAAEDIRTLGLTVGVGGAFDWAIGGNSLLYLAKGAGGTQIRLSRTIGLNNQGTTGQPGEQLVEPVTPGLQSISYQPGGMLISTLQDERSTGCQTVHVYDVFLSGKAQGTSLPHLCVDGRLERESWTPRDQPGSTLRWLVVSGRPEDGSDTGGIYALTAPGPRGAALPAAYVRLSDLQAAEGTVALARPLETSLNIQPQPALAREEALPQAVVPVGLPGMLLAVEKPPPGESFASLSELNPDGLQASVIVPADGAIDCPIWSPDRTKIAFLSDRSFQELAADSDRAQKRGPDELFMLDAAGTGRINQLTHPVFSFTDVPDLVQHYTCPVWSPDGKYLVTVSVNGQGAGVQVVDTSGRMLRFVPSGLPSSSSDLAWIPDGNTLLFAEPAMRGSPATIVRVPWRFPVASNIILSLEGWDDVQGLSVSPDGQQLAMILVRFATINQPARAALRVYRLPGLTMAYQHELMGYDPRMLQSEGHLFWLSCGDLAVLIPGSPLSRYKGIIIRVIASEDILQELVSSEDVIYDWALMGPWLVYASESGLWGIPVAGRFDVRVTPLRLRPENFQSISWR